MLNVTIDLMEVQKLLNGETELLEHKPPFRVGRKLSRAVLDGEGRQVVVFDEGKEIYAHTFVYLMNKHFKP